MDKKPYTDDQIKDIQEREAMGLKMLKELELTPAALLTKVNTGNDLFADKVQPYLQDTKYNGGSDEPIVSPIQKEDITPDEPTETTA